MNTKHHPFFILHPSSFWILLLALFTAIPRAPAQTNWGTALSFNGVNNYVRATIPALASNYTFSAWVYLRAGGAFNFPAGVLSATNCNSSAEVQIGSQTDLPTDPQYLQLGRCVGYYGQPSTNTVALNQWVHIAITVSSTKQANYFINGSPAGSADYSPSQRDTTIGPNITLGDNSYRRFNGMLDEVQIWNKVRSQTEIQESMGRPLTGTEPNLVAYYRFNDGSGTVALDATANHRNGTLVNSPAWTNSTIPFININAGLTPVYSGNAVWADYDNDGNLDVTLAGDDREINATVAQLWRNTGNGVFTKTNTGFTGTMFQPSLGWCDFDNDRRLDLLLTGIGWPVQDLHTELWRNNGDGTFRTSDTGLPAVAGAKSVWCDYNNDGWSDILLMSWYAASAQLWRNNGDGTFTLIPAGLLAGTVAAWGDYNNDGWPDLLLAGHDDDQRVTQLYRNNGDGTFTMIPTGLPGVSEGSVAWGDYNNDGWLDILVAGDLDYGDPITQVWRNNGDGTFTMIPTGLPGVSEGSVAWGDYDNDGRLDILLSGRGTNNLITQLWRNNGDGNFTLIPIGLPGLLYSSVAWGDYDNDGRLDILFTGQLDLSLTGYTAVEKTEVWRNLGATTNTRPAAPTWVSAQVRGHQVTLTWTGASDAQTPESGLTYDLRIGTSNGACNVISPPAIVPSGIRLLPARGSVQPGHPGVVVLPEGVYYWGVQAVDTAFAGSPFSAEGRFVIYLPQARTVGVALVNSTAVTFHGTANPRENDATAWVEYGLSTTYGCATVSTNLGAGTNTVAFDLGATNLLPWMTYHYRTVASNCVGVTTGSDATITMPGPYVTPPNLSGLGGLANLTLAQGGNTSVWFTAAPAGLDVRVRCSNPVLLPIGGLTLGGSGISRSLTIVPAPNQSGSALLTVVGTDGSSTVSSSINVTVVPSASQSAGLLYLTNAQVVSTQAWRFRLVDAGSGSTNYAVEYRSNLASTNVWVPATNVTFLGGGLFEIAIGPPQAALGFYRAKGFRRLMGGFNSDAVTVEEGNGTAGPVLVFNGVYAGTVTCIWTDQQGTSWTNQVQVNGTTAVLPVPASYLSDNGTLGPLRSLTLQLQGAAGFALGETTRSTVTIEENDAEWKGVLQAVNGNLDFTLSLVQTSGGLQGQIRNDGFGFFPTNAPTQLNLTSEAFTLVATNVLIPVLTAYPPLGFTNFLDLRLDAANSPGVTNVSPTQIRGVLTLASKVPSRGHLDAAIYGTFQLLRSPTSPSTNEVPLHPAAP